MDIQEIAVNTAVLQGEVNDMHNALSRIRKRTESMFREINALNGMWEGQAHEAFSIQFTADYQKMLDLQNTVEKLIENMQYARKEYDSCESSIRSIIDTIRA